MNLQVTFNQEQKVAYFHDQTCFMPRKDFFSLGVSENHFI